MLVGEGVKVVITLLWKTAVDGNESWKMNSRFHKERVKEVKNEEGIGKKGEKEKERFYLQTVVCRESSLGP